MLSSDGFLATASYLGADLALLSALFFYSLIFIAIVAQRQESIICMIGFRRPWRC